MSWSIVAAIAGIAAVLVTIWYGERQLRLARGQLRLAQEEAELRPAIVVSFKDVQFHHRPPNPGSKLVQAAIGFDIKNTGRSAAHNIHCEINLEEQSLELDDMHGENRDFFASYMGPKSTKAHSKNVGVRVYGPTKARYRCVCDEVGETEGVIEFQVPEKSS